MAMAVKSTRKRFNPLSPDALYFLLADVRGALGSTYSWSPAALEPIRGRPGHLAATGNLPLLLRLTQFGQDIHWHATKNNPITYREQSREKRRHFNPGWAKNSGGFSVWS